MMNVKPVVNSESIRVDNRRLVEPVFNLLRTGGSGHEKMKNVGTRFVETTVKGKENLKVVPTSRSADCTSNMEGAGDGLDSKGRDKTVTLPSYLQPTLSYRLKCVERPKDDDKRIPFVVGNYANKSHNVGAKIQETLSLIKGSPKRVLEKAEKEKEDLRNLIRCTTAQYPSFIQSQEEMTRHRSVEIKRNHSANAMDGKTTIVDYKNHQFRTVLMNLQDEYAKMNTKYEDLKKMLKDKYSVELAQKVLNMEEELNAKDIEINAFINLYNEVIQLKKILNSDSSKTFQSKGFHDLITSSRFARKKKSDNLYEVKK